MGYLPTTQHSIPPKSEEERSQDTTATLDKYIQGLASSNGQMPAFDTHRAEQASAVPSLLSGWLRWPEAAWVFYSGVSGVGGGILQQSDFGVYRIEDMSKYRSLKG